MFGVALVASVLTTIVFIYLICYILQKLYWIKYGVRQRVDIAMSTVKLIFKPSHLFEQELYNKAQLSTNCNLVGYFDGHLRPVLLIGDLKCIKRILIKDYHMFTKEVQVNDLLQVRHLHTQGVSTKWTNLRSLSIATLSPFKIRRVAYIVSENSSNLVQNLRKASQFEKPVDIKSYLHAFVIELIASVVFAVKFNAIEDPNYDFWLNAQKVLTGGTPLGQVVKNLCPHRLSQRFQIDQEPLQYFQDAIDRLMTERRRYSGSSSSMSQVPRAKQARRRSNFVQIMLEVVDSEDVVSTIAEEDQEDVNSRSSKVKEEDIKQAVAVVAVDEEDDHQQQQQKPKKSKQKKSNVNESDTLIDIDRVSSPKNASDDELLALGLLFLTCGYKTIRDTLSSTVQFLMDNSDTQEKLLQEVDTHPDADMSYEKLNQMPYLQAVLSETLRLLPPITRLERKCTVDYRLGSTGVIIPAGMRVHIPIYALHRDSNYFQNPNDFNPDRFLKESTVVNDDDDDTISINSSNLSSSHKSVSSTFKPFFPFGDGPNSCVGAEFTYLVMKICFYKLLKNFKFKSSKTAESERSEGSGRKVSSKVKRAMVILEARDVNKTTVTKDRSRSPAND